MIGAMTNPYDPTNGYGKQDNDPFSGGYGGQQPSGTEFPQYGQDSGYGDTGTGANPYGGGYQESAYAPGPGFQHPENDNASESGRPMFIPGGSLPVVEPIPFSFKRLFTKNWHVYIGFTALMLFLMTAAMALFMVPMIQEIANDPNIATDPTYNPIENNLGGYIAFYAISLVVSFVMSIVLYNVALRDTRGEAPSWGGLFKGIPWGQVILVYILIGLGVGALAVLISFISGLVMAAVPVLGVVVMLVLFLAMIFLGPLITLIPLYVIDGRETAVGAFKAAWNDLKPNYWQVLAAMILVGIVSFMLVVFTLFLATIIALPFQMIAYVFIYRWISEDKPQQEPEQPSGYMTMY